MPSHIKNVCKNNGRLYKSSLGRRNKISSFYMESRFPDQFTGGFTGCVIGTHRGSLRMKCITRWLCTRSSWWLAHFYLKYVLFAWNSKSPIRSQEGLSWAVVRLSPVLSLALKATWLLVCPSGESFVLGSKVIAHVCLHTSA